MNEISISLPTGSTNLVPPTREYPRRDLLRALPTPGHYLLILDNSNLESFTTCNRSAEYKLVYSREAHARNAALVFGGAIHEALESLYTGADEATQNQKLVDFFAQNPAPPDEFRTVGNALEVMRLYRQHASIDPDYVSEQPLFEWHEETQTKRPIVERAFELPLGVLDVDAKLQLPSWDRPHHITQIHVAYSGRIDRVLHCNNANRVMDHKTGTVIEPLEYLLASQTIGYVWAGRQLWPEHDITGFCLNALRLKKPTGSGPLNAPGPRGGEPALRFFRAYFEYPEETLRRWEVNTMALVTDFVHDLLRNYFPMKTKWCFGKFGKCPYHDVCTLQEPAVQLRYLNSEVFKDVTWDPVAGR